MMSTVGRFPINDGARLAPFTEGGHHFSVSLTLPVREYALSV